MKNYKIKTLLLGLFMVVFSSAFAQKTITGSIQDGETSEPIIGATIQVTGTGAGAVSDLDGNFAVQLPNGKNTLTISYVGYKTQTVKVEGRMSHLNIRLQVNNNDLDEVVVVGYGTQKKAHLTGSVENIPVEDIQDISSGNLASTLSGLVNGLNVSGGDAQPGEAATITVRNANTLGDLGSTVQQPLFVIDGYI